MLKPMVNRSLSILWFQQLTAQFIKYVKYIHFLYILLYVWSAEDKFLLREIIKEKLNLTKWALQKKCPHSDATNTICSQNRGIYPHN